jgi:thiamine biosynthesis protein ThiS
MTSSGINDTMRITVNGEPRTLRSGSTVAELVRELGLVPTQVAVERNKVIVRRSDHASTQLHDGDRLEVVTFFGGG